MIELTRLQKIIGQTTLIDIDVLRVSAGEITAVTGLTGPHKQTFLDLLTGKITPTAGTVRLAGVDPAREPKHLALKMGMLPSQNGLYTRLTVRQNLKVYAELYGLPVVAVDRVLERVGLTDRMHTRVDELSPGLARRLALGRALLHQPDVLLLVDPFLDCDATAVSWISRLVTEIAAENKAVLVTENGRISTHLTLSEVEKRLERSGFFRTHRSFLVNLQYLKEIISYTRNSFTLILENGADTIEVPLSKGAAKELRELLNY